MKGHNKCLCDDSDEGLQHKFLLRNKENCTESYLCIIPITPS